MSLSRNGFEVKEIKLNRSSVWKLALETAFGRCGGEGENISLALGWKYLEVWAAAWHPTPQLNEDLQVQLTSEVGLHMLLYPGAQDGLCRAEPNSVAWHRCHLPNASVGIVPWKPPEGTALTH